MFCIFAPSFRSIFTTQCNTCVIRCCVIRNTLEKCSVLRYNKSRKQGKGNRGKNMAETKELKPKSFRIDEETAEKFKAISAELGNNQQQTLSKLIETYEFQKGKTVLNQKRGEIETFEKYVTILTRMYMDSLEHNENITESVHAEFEGILGSKDETILSLQKQLKTAEEQVAAKKAEATESLKKAKDSDTENARLLAKIEENQASFEQALEDKEKLILALTQACDGYKKVPQLTTFSVIPCGTFRIYPELSSRNPRRTFRSAPRCAASHRKVPLQYPGSSARKDGRSVSKR